MEKSLKREFELLYLGFTQFRAMSEDQVATMSADLQQVPGMEGPWLRTWLASKFGVTKTGNLAAAMDKRWKEVSKRQGRQYRLEKLRRTLSRLEMQVRGDPDEFDREFDAEVRSLLDLQ